jgi:hypothetical protein
MATRKRRAIVPMFQPRPASYNPCHCRPQTSKPKSGSFQQRKAANGSAGEGEAEGPGGKADVRARTSGVGGSARRGRPLSEKGLPSHKEASEFLWELQGSLIWAIWNSTSRPVYGLRFVRLGDEPVGDTGKGSKPRPLVRFAFSWILDAAEISLHIEIYLARNCQEVSFDRAA